MTRTYPSRGPVRYRIIATRGRYGIGRHGRRSVPPCYRVPYPFAVVDLRSGRIIRGIATYAAALALAESIHPP